MQWPGYSCCMPQHLSTHIKFAACIIVVLSDQLAFGWHHLPHSWIGLNPWASFVPSAHSICWLQRSTSLLASFPGLKKRNKNYGHHERLMAWNKAILANNSMHIRITRLHCWALQLHGHLINLCACKHAGFQLHAVLQYYYTCGVYKNTPLW